MRAAATPTSARANIIVTSNSQGSSQGKGQASNQASSRPRAPSAATIMPIAAKRGLPVSRHCGAEIVDIGPGSTGMAMELPASRNQSP